MEARNADLSSLRIDRTAPVVETRRPVRSRWPFVAAAVIVVLAAAVWGISRFLFDAPLEVHLVTASWTTPSQSDAVLTASGYVVAQRKAAVASKGTGRLNYLGVVEGDRVKKDQIIARLDDADIAAALEQAKASYRLNVADLTNAERTLQRTKDLFQKGLATQADYDAAEAAYRRVQSSIEVAKAAVDGAQVALENMLIRAPFDGTVLTKNADVGEIVAPFAASASSKAAVVTIADMSSLQVEADVSESNIERIVIDQPCEITLDAYPSVRYQGFVSKIVPTADRAKATVLVKVGFRSYDSRVLPEMSAKVLFLTQSARQTKEPSQPAITVPSTAVADRGGRSVVYVVQESRAVEHPVTVGRKFGELTEIVRGVSAGDRVIEKVLAQIQNGSKVTVQ